MSDKVSKSETGQNQVPPSREERDAAYSDGGGRMAAEESKEPREHIAPPVGLDMETRADEVPGEASEAGDETRADEEWSEGMYEDPQEAQEDEGGEHPTSPSGSTSDTDELPEERESPGI